jgi:hypothetical protein
MEYAVEMGSGTLIYIPGFIKTSSGIRNLTGWDTQTHRQQGDQTSHFYSSKLGR